MSESQQSQNQPHLLLTMTLIVLETIFTFILKHDRVVALQAKKFVDENITIKSIVIFHILISMFSLPKTGYYLTIKHQAELLIWMFAPL